MVNDYYKKHLDELKQLAKKYKAFNLKLTQKLYGQINIKDIRNIIKDVLYPISKSASDCYLYNDGDEAPFSEGLLKVIKKERGKYRFNNNEDIFTGLETFWGSCGYRRGSVLFVNDISPTNLTKIFENTFDPYILTNLGTIFSPSPVKFAHKIVENNKDKIIFGLPSSNGLERSTVFLSSETVDKYFELAVNSCQISW